MYPIAATVLSHLEVYPQTAVSYVGSGDLVRLVGRVFSIDSEEEVHVDVRYNHAREKADAKHTKFLVGMFGVVAAQSRQIRSVMGGLHSRHCPNVSPVGRDGGSAERCCATTILLL